MNSTNATFIRTDQGCPSPTSSPSIPLAQRQVLSPPAPSQRFQQPDKFKKRGSQPFQSSTTHSSTSSISSKAMQARENLLAGGARMNMDRFDRSPTPPVPNSSFQHSSDGEMPPPSAPAHVKVSSSSTSSHFAARFGGGPKQASLKTQHRKLSRDSDKDSSIKSKGEKEGRTKSKATGRHATQETFVREKEELTRSPSIGAEHEEWQGVQAAEEETPYFDSEDQEEEEEEEEETPIVILSGQPAQERRGADSQSDSSNDEDDSENGAGQDEGMEQEEQEAEQTSASGSGTDDQHDEHAYGMEVDDQAEELPASLFKTDGSFVLLDRHKKRDRSTSGEGEEDQEEGEDSARKLRRSESQVDQHPDHEASFFSAASQRQASSSPSRQLSLEPEVKPQPEAPRNPLATVAERFPGPNPHLQQADARLAAPGAVNKWEGCTLEEWQKGGEELTQRFAELMQRTVALVGRKKARTEEQLRLMDEHRAALREEQKKIDGTKENLKKWAGEIIGKGSGGA